MTLPELLERLDALAWREQVDFEASERHPGATSDVTAIEADLRALAADVTPALLDALEREGLYPAWVLRLSPFVAGDDPGARARRLGRHPDATVRYEAARLLGRRRRRSRMRQ